MRLDEEPVRQIAAVLRDPSKALLVPTSGSTGAPREVRLTGEALAASGNATHAALSGPGSWLLATPIDRIAGIMVAVRSMLAGTPLGHLPHGTFTGAGFASYVEGWNTDGPRYVSLVPTQLHRVLESPAGRAALATFDAVLVGGAPLHRDAPSEVVTTYGSTETCGGCVYDGLPIGDTQFRLVDGRVWLSGPTLALGYVDGDDSAFVTDDGVRWFVTSDIGEVDEDGRLRILGRADHVINTGGVKVHPVAVERALESLPYVDAAIVVGLPDPEWGARAVALVETASGIPQWRLVREALRSDLPAPAIPRDGWAVETLPTLASGKIDRSAAQELAAKLALEDR
mgnify:CR=1 FL=1